MRMMTLLTALSLGLSATALHADLSPQDISTLTGKFKPQVHTSDGLVLGTIDGIRFNGDRARLYLLTRGGTVFRRTGGKDIVVTTRTDKLTLKGSALVLDDVALKVRIKANKSFTDDSSPITILLLN